MCINVYKRHVRMSGYKSEWLCVDRWGSETKDVREIIETRTEAVAHLLMLGTETPSNRDCTWFTGSGYVDGKSVSVMMHDMPVLLCQRVGFFAVVFPMEY